MRHWVIYNIRKTVERLRGLWIWHNNIRRNESPNRRIIISRIVVIQTEGIVEALGGEAGAGGGDVDGVPFFTPGCVAQV